MEHDMHGGHPSVAWQSSTRSDRALLVAVIISAVLHAGGLYAADRWGSCVCNFGEVVCPKLCADPAPRINLNLSKLEQPTPPPPPKPRAKPEAEPKPLVIAEHKPGAPLAAPKRGAVVLPDEAFEESAGPSAEITVDRPQLPEDAVVRESEAGDPVIASAEIFGRAEQLTPGPVGVFGLGGTGEEATGIGPFGTAEQGSGTGEPGPRPVPVVQPEPEPAKPKGPTRPPRALNWTDPPYPEQARQQGVEGTVVLRLTVTADGRPQHMETARSSGHSALDEAALAHVRKTKFSPALKDGEPIAMTIGFRVKFRLVNA